MDRYYPNKGAVREALRKAKLGYGRIQLGHGI